MNLDSASSANRLWWDSVRNQRDRGLISTRHDVAAEILAGLTGLTAEQPELLGDVRGRRLLDLGCGDGLELIELSLAGAEAVGVDNSPAQLTAAARAADQLDVTCRLILADLLRLPEDLQRGDFDIVFSSWVTTWIGDLDTWFAAVTKALRGGGHFLLTGQHPLSGFVAEQARSDGRSNYFDEGPFDEITGHSPRWNPLGEPYRTVEWCWTLGSLVTAIATAGLRIQAFVEVRDAANKAGLPAGYPSEFVLLAAKD